MQLSCETVSRPVVSQDEIEPVNSLNDGKQRFKPPAMGMEASSYRPSIASES